MNIMIIFIPMISPIIMFMFFSIETCHRIRALEADAIVAAGHAGPIPLGNKVPAEFTPAGLKSAMATGDFCD